MKRFKVLLLSTLVVSATLISIVALNMIRADTSAQPSACLALPCPPNGPFFTYTAKWICNTPFVQPGFNSTVVNTGDAENIGLVPAEYKTDINVHNPGPGNVSILKKFVVSLPESLVMPRPGPTAFVKTFAGPDVAFFITCDEIQKLLNLPPLHAFKGFVILQTTVSSLDVVAEYSSEAFDFSPECPVPSFPPFASTSCPEGLTLEVQKISPVPTTTPITPCSPSSTISANPSSLTLPRGQSNVTANIVITNSPCATITECFAVSIAPAVTSGPAAFVFPSCITLAPGGSASAVLVINASAATPTGVYSVTVTATCAACSPVLVQTVSLVLTVV